MEEERQQREEAKEKQKDEEAAFQSIPLSQGRRFSDDEEEVPLPETCEEGWEVRGQRERGRRKK